jgi:hypothetical protein
MKGNDDILGMVRNGWFQPLDPQEVPARLTTVQMQASVPPESGELDLAAYEGQAVMVRGQSAGGWIYSAEVIDEGGPILTAVVQQVFGKEDILFDPETGAA